LLRAIIQTKEGLMLRALFAGLTAVTAFSGPSALPAFGQEESDQRLGTVHFPTSCNETAQRRFDRGMRYQHSFWYRESRGIFEDVIRADPECGIAYWGIALSYLDNPHNPPPPANLPLGLAAIEKAKAVGAKTQRERDFIDALLVYYTDYDKVPHPARVQSYLKAIEAVAQRYPDDDEAQLFYGITLNVAASPNDKTYSNQLKGAAILEKVFQRQPRHPGVAHYLIHLYDTPALAEKGINAATRYSEIAPAAPHAQHMPSHIFTRVGYWKESIALNTVSARAAKADKEPIDQLHAMDYLVYAYLQLGQDDKARSIVDEMKTVAGVNPNAFAGLYALAASPARYMIERGDWKGAAELQPPSTPLAHVQAMTYFARALGEARTGHPDLARADLAEATRGEGRLLVGAGRHSGADRKRLGAVRRGQIRRRSQSDERGRRGGGQNREASGHAWRARAGARTLWRHAARPRHGPGSACRLRSDHQERAEPLERLPRCS
jgi:tetratricopeptide (TPR) repeat protein